MASKEVIQKLSKLSEREREVLRLVCADLEYKEVAKQLYISLSAVKAEMARVYLKLELDQLPRDRRRLKLFEVYCPALDEADLAPPPPEAEEPIPVPEEVERMVEEDERALARWGQTLPARLRAEAEADAPPYVITIPSRPGAHGEGRPHPFRWIGLGLLLGALIIMSLLFILDRVGVGRAPQAISPPATLIVPVTAVVIVTTTPAPPPPTPLPVVQQVVVTHTQVITVVVTATPLPATSTPRPTATPTEPANTPEDAVLEVGEWWKANGVWLRVSEVEFRTYAPNFLIVSLELWNQTGDRLLFEWTVSGSFSLTDNTGHKYLLVDGEDKEIYEPGELYPLYQGPYASTFSSGDDFLFNASVTELYLTVTNLSRISYARFRIPVPK